MSLYSRFVNRPFGRVFACLAFVAGISPNLVTGLSSAATLCGLVVLATVPPDWWTGILVGGLLVVGFALDSADGQVARLRGLSSPAGEWLDHVVDAGKMVGVHTAVLIAAHRFFDVPGAWLFVPLAFQFVTVTVFTGLLLVTFLTPARTEPASTARPSLVRSIGLLPLDYGTLAWAFMVSGIPALFVPAYSVLCLLNAALGVVMLVRWFRQLAVESQ